MESSIKNQLPGSSTTSFNQAIKTNSLFAYKLGMATFFTDRGECVPVTVLKYESLVVSQLKRNEKDRYEALQIASVPRRASRSSKAEKGHLAKAGFENGARLVAEIRQPLPDGVKVGDKISIDSLSKGDLVKVTASSKGRGFAGVVKRYNFAGGPAAHGSKFHRRPGSSGNRTWPGRVMPGKRFPGHFGNKIVSVKNLVVVEINTEDQVILIKGAVPGGRNNLVRLTKLNSK